MSGATGAAGGGAAGGRKGSAQAGSQGGHQAPGGARRPSGEQPAASTSLMPPVADARPGGPAPAPGQGAAGGYGYPPQPPQTPPSGGAAAASAPAAGNAATGYSQPTTYTKGQRTPPRGTRTGGTAAPRRSAAAAGPASARTRKARLRVTKVDPWSVMKVSFLLSIALGVVTIVASCVLWMVLDGIGVFDSVGGTLKDVTGSDSSQGFDLQSFLSFGKTFMFSTIIAVVDVVLLTALATLGAFIYNTVADFTGGVEVTLAEEE
ncbi:DUF3566 domain-containing protein [Streptacidiphilus sp. ASG 303]|uniref:DUF3566 domain-containing protein n=1 Tax=Streptacidiphilus sp. ASG 303 TaxID=2896847 RepID=UPI001E36B696|nr:DUF3566 domain-containing protein [Streptacidiphilus sp. ASG 303]MCD0482215.1 DUF3566 domain-containing protein [Streptacidiphilus sp. ASG 303]